MNTFKKISLCILLFVCVFSLSACSFFKQFNCEHVWEDTVEKEATCTEDGTSLRTCTICGKTMHKKIPSTGHNFEVSENVPAECMEDGYIIEVCANCGEERRTVNEHIGHHVIDGEVVNASCLEDGSITGTCEHCGLVVTTVIEALGHDFSDFEIIRPATNTTKGLKRRVCDRCGFVEEVEISEVDYIDLDIIEYNFEVKDLYNASSEEELTLLYCSAILNRVETLSVNLNFTYDSFNNLFDRLKENQKIEESYSSSASLSGKRLTFDFTYASLPSRKTESSDRYIQYNSLNYNQNSEKRSEDFDNFKINSSLLSYKAVTSKQLVYVLERGVKPILEDNTSAKALYNKAKEVLREIVDDEMSDLEKVKAIHDYLIMNVTYDNALYNLLYEGEEDLKSYNGFYLEGVFNDGIAVCEGISEAFTVLCNIEGIPAVSISGYSMLNPNGAGHAWNKVCIDGRWYVIDCTSDGTVVNSRFEILSYEYFLISEEKMENSSNKYKAKTGKSIKCLDNFDVYSYFKYDGENTFTVHSFTELKKLVKAFHDLAGSKKTVQFKFAYSPLSSLSSEVNRAYMQNLYTNSFSYIENGDVFTIIEG